MDKGERVVLGAVMVWGLVALLCWSAPRVHAEDATCEDVYAIYKTCYDGGRQMDQSGCDYLVQALGPRLMGEDGLSGFSAALSVAMCKRGCEDGASGKKAMSMREFRREFCGGKLK